MTLGESLKSLREHAGLSQNALAKLTGVPQSVISDVERGVQPTITLETAKELADALGVTLDRLAGRRGPAGE
jgi:transcriptional regulator with XRE-family HTH domain